MPRPDAPRDSTRSSTPSRGHSRICARARGRRANARPHRPRRDRRRGVLPPDAPANGITPHRPRIRRPGPSGRAADAIANEEITAARAPLARLRWLLAVELITSGAETWRPSRRRRRQRRGRAERYELAPPSSSSTARRWRQRSRGRRRRFRSGHPAANRARGRRRARGSTLAPDAPPTDPRLQDQGRARRQQPASSTHWRISCSWPAYPAGRRSGLRQKGADPRVARDNGDRPMDDGKVGERTLLKDFVGVDNWKSYINEMSQHGRIWGDEATLLAARVLEGVRSRLRHGAAEDFDCSHRGHRQTVAAVLHLLRLYLGHYHEFVTT